MRTLGRHRLLVGLIGAGLIALLALGSLNYDKLPFFNQNKVYSAYFAEAGGLSADAPVQVSGFRVGEVTSARWRKSDRCAAFDTRRVSDAI